jgi:hypothetical protein
VILWFGDLRDISSVFTWGFEVLYLSGRPLFAWCI